MATFLEAVQALLDPLAPAGSFYGINPTEPLALDGDDIAGFIVWQRVVSTDEVTLAGPTEQQQTVIQVDFFAPRIATADAMKKAADAALASLRAVPLTSQDIYEEPVRLWRISRDYSIWYDESQP